MLLQNRKAVHSSIHLHARLDVDGGDLLHDLGGRVQVDHALVDPHLELVPGLGTLTWGRGDFIEQAPFNRWEISDLSFGQESRI